MNRFWSAMCVAVMGIAMVLPAFAQQQTKSPWDTGNSPAASTQRGGGRYDAQIQQAVAEELKKHDWAKNVRSSVEDGMVTLQGSVPMYMQKVRLYQKIHNKDHVQGVRNLVAVSGPNVPDNELKQKLADRLAYNRYGYGSVFDNLTLDVKSGVVIVGGKVHDPVSGQSAIAEIENTPGVKDVVDNIQVLPTSIYDDDIRVAVARAIYGHSALQKYAIDPVRPIRIVVENGHVTLEGVVNNAMDKQIAAMQAKSVPNVFSVTDKLQVAGQKSATAQKTK